MEIITQKRCPKCNMVKSVNEFNKSKSTLDGLYGWCKGCKKIQSSLYYTKKSEQINQRNMEWSNNNRERINKKNRENRAKNPDKYKMLDKIWYEKNREHNLEVGRKYRAEHKEQVAKTIRAWQLANKERTAISKHNRHVREGVGPEKITVQEWKDLLKKYDNRCLRCGRNDVKITMDHVIPLIKGGSNGVDNIQPLCGSCNSIKHDKIIDYRW